MKKETDCKNHDSYMQNILTKISKIVNKKQSGTRYLLSPRESVAITVIRSSLRARQVVLIRPILQIQASQVQKIDVSL